MKLVQFGAGNIGRSFVGQIFSRAGWEVVFIDVDSKIIDELNRKRHYTVVVKDRVEQHLLVEGVRGIIAGDEGKVVYEVATADVVSTAVGQGALPYIMKNIALGLIERQKISPNKPLDIIICENMRGAGAFFKEALRTELPAGFPLEDVVGFVETSIGKMVPIMRDEEKRSDPLLIYAEAYNTLLVDKKGFRGPIPEIPELDPKENMTAYIDRKLYIHNLGHAVLAYVSCAFRPQHVFVWEAALDRELVNVTREAMWEAGRALIEEYPAEFNKINIGEHIEDLLLRFGNRALGDTIFRAGRDLYRKLSPEDRLAGGARLCLKHGIEPKRIALGIASALFFKAADERSEMFPRDRLFHEREASRGALHVLREICGLSDEWLIDLIKRFYTLIGEGSKDLSGIL